MNPFKRNPVTPSAPPTEAAVIAALDGVADPVSGLGLAAAGRVAVKVEDGRARAVLDAGEADPALYAGARAAAEAALAGLPGVTAAQVVLTAERPPPRRRAALASDVTPPGPSRAAVLPDHVRRVIAVASGKGGVGKSTVAVNLALAFARRGMRTGLLDADVYGPSAPRMLGLTGRPEIDADKRITPLHAHGLKVMSVGVLLEEGGAAIWRGPMASRALEQMAMSVAWGVAEAPLDILVIDLPPGTGDIQLTLVQKIALSGAVLVSTPQALALDDVRRGAALFEKTGVPVLGVIENMAWFVDSTGARCHPFGEGGARRFAQAAGLPFLGELPLETALRIAGDEGRPLVDGPAAEAFDRIAATLA